MVQRSADERRRSEAEAESVRNATMTLLAIATTYLVCNSISFFITLLERLPGEPFLYLYDAVRALLHPLPSPFPSFPRCRRASPTPAPTSTS